jgi:lantibiotic modifying enzyme
VDKASFGDPKRSFKKQKGTVDGLERITVAGLDEASALLRASKRVMATSDWGLYGGLAGMAVFLAQVSEETQDSRFSSAAEAMLNTAWEGFLRSESPQIGLSDGIAGLAYASSIVARSTGHRNIADLATQNLVKIKPSDKRTLENDLDLLAGSCGVLLSALRLASVSRLPTLNILIESLTSRVLKAAKIVVESANSPPGVLFGMSHGLSGAALTLATCYEVSGREDCLHTAIALAKAETARGYIKPFGWIDLRHTVPTFTNSWCHGAAGIGLARLQLWRLAPEDDVIRSDLIEAVRLCGDVCLEIDQPCCGELGRLTLLSAVARESGSKALANVVAVRAGNLLNRREELGYFRNGASGPANGWGLFQGRAGIGYSLMIAGGLQMGRSFLEFP